MVLKMEKNSNVIAAIISPGNMGFTTREGECSIFTRVSQEFQTSEN